MKLVLSSFPGIDVLGLGFQREGFCVVKGPDVIFGEDVREWHGPPGIFDGCLFGDPCQSHSALANLVRAKGLEPSFPDMTPEVVRLVEELRPTWFLRENVPRAPEPKPLGYSVHSFLLDHSTLDSGNGWGHEQMRRRRFWFGVREGEAPDLRRWIDFALFVPPDRTLSVDGEHDYIDARKGRIRRQAIAGDARSIPVALGGSRKRKATVDTSNGGGRRDRHDNLYRAAADSGRNEGDIGKTGGHSGNAPRYSLAEMLRLQGLPSDFLDRCPWTMQGKRKAIGNCVPLPMARALARAVRSWLEEVGL